MSLETAFSKREHLRKGFEDIFGKFDEFYAKIHNNNHSQGQKFGVNSKLMRPQGSPSLRGHSPVHVQDVRDIIQTMTTLEDPIGPLPKKQKPEKDNHLTQPSGSSDSIITPEERKRKKRPEETDKMPKKHKKQEEEDFGKESMMEKSAEVAAVSPDSGVHSNENFDEGQVTTAEEILAMMNFSLSPMLSPLNSPEKQPRAEEKKRKRERSVSSVASVSTVSSVASSTAPRLLEEKKKKAEKKPEIRIEHREERKPEKEKEEPKEKPKKTKKVPLSEPLLSDTSSSEDEEEQKKKKEVKKKTSDKTQVSLNPVKSEKLQKLFDLAKKYHQLVEAQPDGRHAAKNPEPKPQKEEKKKKIAPVTRIEKVKAETPQQLSRPSSSASSHNLNDSVGVVASSFGGPHSIPPPSVSSCSDPPTAKTTPRPESSASVRTDGSKPSPSDKSPSWHCLWSTVVPTGPEPLPKPDDPSQDAKVEFYQKLGKTHKHTADKESNQLKKILEYMTSTSYFLLSAKATKKPGKANTTNIEISLIRDTASFFYAIIYGFGRNKEDNVVLQNPLLTHFLPRVKVLGQCILAILMYQHYMLRMESSMKTAIQLERVVEKAYAAHKTDKTKEEKDGEEMISMTFKNFEIQRQHMKMCNLLMISNKYWADSKSLSSMVDPTFLPSLEKATGITLALDMSVESFAIFILTAVAALRNEYEREVKLPDPHPRKMKPLVDLAMKHSFFPTDGSIGVAPQPSSIRK